MSYIPRIQKAINYIEDNLKNDILLEDVAGNAAFSPFHFHRVFSICVGETVKTYIRKRRLTEAAYELRDTNRKILDIAIDYRFETQESFSRAFKKLFKETPAKYRNLTRFPNFFERKTLTPEEIVHRIDNIELNPKEKYLEPFWVAGLEYSGPLENNGGEISKLWDQFIPRMEEIKNHSSKDVAYGVCFANKYMIKQGMMSYMASLPVNDGENPPEGMRTKKIEGGKYIVLTHKGPISKYKMTVEYVYKTWLPGSGYEIDDRADLELYDHRFTPDGEDSEVDMYIPIK